MLVSVAVAASLAAGDAPAEVVIEPVMGDVQLDVAEVECSDYPSGCMLCVNDVDNPGDTRLIVACGQRLPGVATWANVQGTVRPFVVLDGVEVTPSLLPFGSRVRTRLGWLDRAYPPSCPGGVPPGVTYAIGDDPTRTVTGDGEATVEVDAGFGDVIPFTFDVCSQFVWWGVGCDIAGSQSYRWSFLAPEVPRAFALAAGDAEPISLPGDGILLDVLDSPGGAVTITRVDAEPPAGPAFVGAPGYWDVETDMPSGSYSARVELSFDVGTLPAEAEPSELVIAVYDPSRDRWESLETTLDLDLGLAGATTERLSMFIVTMPPAVPVETLSWGSLKATY